MSCSGDVHIILCDGCTLKADRGIAVNANNYLTIYGQCRGTGRLKATTDGVYYENYSGSETAPINNIETAAIGGNSGKGSGLVTINGGNVTASSHGTGAQNGTDCGIYVNGGGEIRLGWTNTTDSIQSNSYSGSVILERPFVSNGTVYQAGTADNNAIAAKELTPSYTERNVNIGELSHGTVTVDSTAQVVGNTVKLNVTPDSGYMISKVMCGNTQLTPVNGVYSFVMPDADVTVTAEFVRGYMDLVVGGTAVNRMNFGDILGDGTASYDYDTNTLSLNNAVIEIAKYKNFPTAFGIRYNVDSDIPFKIVLSGTNVIADNISDDAGTKYGIALTSMAPSYEIMGGTLTISCSASGNTEVCGIHTRKILTVNGTQLTENITTGGTANGIGLYQNSPVMSLTNGANVSLDINGPDGAALVSNQKNNNISIGTESILTAKESNGIANDNVSLTGENYEVIVNTSASENGASQWDQTTALSTYKYIQITKYKVLPGSMTNGTLTSDLHYYDPGEVVTLIGEGDNGYHLDSVSLASAYERLARELPLTAIDGTNADGSENCHQLVDGNSESKWVTSVNSYIIMDAQSKVEMTGYSLITGNDNESYTGRNWKNYTIYGANFESAAQATRDSSEWNEIKSVVDDNVLEDINFKRYDFPLDSPAEAYRYYKIEIASNKGGRSCQMSEFILKGRSSIP